jgi:uncharacterized membrane protein
MESLIAGTAVACAAMGGVFFAFSSFVMRALARMPPAQGIAAMQSINVVAVTPVFMTALFGTAVACLAVAVSAVTEWRGVTSAYLLAGGLTYLIGTIAVTIVFNVPLNNALAAANPASGEAVLVWTKYARTWTRWNHVRTVSGLVAATLLLLTAKAP